MLGSVHTALSDAQTPSVGGEAVRAASAGTGAPAYLRESLAKICFESLLEFSFSGKCWA